MFDKRTLALALLASFTLLAIPAAAADDGLELRAGLWHTRTSHTIEVPGMPRMPARSRASRECLSGESLDPSKLFDTEAGCRIEDRLVKNGVMSFRITCPAPEGQMTGNARYESDGDTGSGRLEMRFLSGELEGKVVITMKTKRIGDC